MLFNSITFVLFHILCVACYWSFKKDVYRKTLLALSSFVFYAWFYWPGLFLLLGTLGLNYILACKIEELKSRKILVFALVLNLSSLAFFKYSEFITENVVLLAGLFNVKLSPPEWNYWLPLGISFYTFQAIAYLVDVYRGTIQAERNILDYMVFTSLYAQLVAGPIVRAVDLLPQLKEKRAFKADLFQLGIYYILAGLFIKVVIADTLGQFVDYGFEDPTQLNLLNSWAIIYAFSVQILCDFWGYSTIALGIANMYGYHIPLNFNNPYIADSITDFWRRWHLTLSHWLRDYLYYPLGGGRSKKYRNLFMTMTLAGLWHGASWNFVVYGMGHGSWIVVERIFMDRKWKFKLPRLLKIVIIFQVLSLLRVFFRSPNFKTSLAYFKSLCGFYPNPQNVPESLGVQLLLFLLFMVFFEKSTRDDSFLRWSLLKQVLVSALFIALILTFAENKLDFIYFVF